MEIAIILTLLTLVILSLINLLSKRGISQEKVLADKERILELEKLLSTNNEIIKNHQQNIALHNVKINDFEQIKMQNISLRAKLDNTEDERNNLKNETVVLRKAEENRNETLRKSVESTNILQSSLTNERQRLNDERVKETKDNIEKLKKSWVEHEKDIENYIQLICRKHVIKYISQENFPHARNKPDNSIEIMDQLIIFDAKSPANDDLSNFPKYIKSQTENLKKYAKHEDVKKDLFLVIPSNTLHVIRQFTYNISDYNVYVVTKDALEPIIISLKKIEEYEFADKLSPEERDNVCRIIGKFAHTTKRRIQIDQFFADEFLDTLQKAGSHLPREILESVIQFENAERLNPPMEKRNKQILTKDLKEKSNQISRETELRKIPKIKTEIVFKENKDEE
tara:strand:+ start:580 stop:1770 length:1191 start_codon:yes stop_codon:yes gene_type:complete